MKYLLDTNTCIALINQRSAQVEHQLQTRGVEQVGVSSITVAELAFGVMKSQSTRNQAMLRGFLAPIEIAPFDGHAAWSYGAVRASLERKGTPIGPFDMQIAGHALALGCTVVTNNVREFARVPGLRVEDWS